jgi:hypothetical protein
MENSFAFANLLYDVFDAGSDQRASGVMYVIDGAGPES